MLYYVAASVVQGGIKSLVSLSWWATGKVVETSVDMSSALIFHALIPWSYGMITGGENSTSRQEIVDKIESLKQELDEIDDSGFNELPEDNMDNLDTYKKLVDQTPRDKTLPGEDGHNSECDLTTGWALLSEKE